MSSEDALKVFISYSHDSPEHMDRVGQLADRLRDEGIDCNIDQYEMSPPDGWARWTEAQVEESKFVLVVCTETYERRFKAREKPGTGLGVTWEGAVITQQLYDAASHNTKFVPVLFSPQDSKYIPLILRGTTNYVVSDEEGYESLYRYLTNKPRILRPKLGKVRPMPPLERGQKFRAAGEQAVPARTIQQAQGGAADSPPQQIIEAARAGGPEGAGHVQDSSGVVGAVSPVSHESDVPFGFKLRRELRGHSSAIREVAWSSNGEWLASGSTDRAFLFWSAESGSSLIRRESTRVQCLAWSKRGNLFASGATDGVIRLWDKASEEPYRTLEKHAGSVRSVSWSPEDGMLASGGQDKTVRVWDTQGGHVKFIFLGHDDWVTNVAWRPDSKVLASASYDTTVRLWDLDSQACRHVMKGHSDWVLGLCWSPDGRLIVSASRDHTVRVWDGETGREERILEGHTGGVTSVSFSADGRLIATKSLDGTVRLWRTDSWQTAAILKEESSPNNYNSHAAFHPSLPVLATLGEKDYIIRLWDIDIDSILAASAGAPTVLYVNAKVVLVGDSGVGKSALGMVLSGKQFTATESTHGRHVWPFDNEEVRSEEGVTEIRETLMWDLAGQPGYRLIHQLHLNEAAVALIIFDSKSEADPFSGVSYWNRALQQAESLAGHASLKMKKFLVAARTDRGGVGVGPQRIDALLSKMGFAAYFETSAKEGRNVPELAEAVRRAIEWDKLPKVSSTDLFKSIKDFLLEEKKAGRLLTSIDDLYVSFRRANDIPAGEADAIRAQFETCIGRVEAQGLIRRLSFGALVLLQPELLDSYASAMVIAAKDEPDGLGSLSEEEARMGHFSIPEDERVKNKNQESLLIIATIEDMLRHEIAFREQAGGGSYLVFPSQLTRENPDLPDPEGKSVSFTFEGPLLSIYATLIVRLSHSSFFAKQEMWKNAVTFRSRTGGVCGLFLRTIEEGRGEITLFFNSATSDETRFNFEEYIHTHLLRRALVGTITRRHHLKCPECGEPVTDGQVQGRLKRGFKTILCPVCGYEISLRQEEHPAPPVSSVVSEMDEVAATRQVYDTGLVSAVGELQSGNFKKWAGAARGTLAIVFTEIVGPADLTSNLGNEPTNETRRTHFEGARALVNRHAGYEVKTIGDSFIAAFHTAAQAVHFALRLQADAGDRKITIRAAIHLGQVSLDENEVFGQTVNFASGMISLAKGAEIWLSDEARRQLQYERGEGYPEARWEQHSGCTLKGVPDPQVLWSTRTPV